eukprot:TRINITY_DN13998_c0_g1_i3.p1 TRINITY_DN13998_c0_g1~~TRINITY_DN13998_c0_g1_i3.p1  ORF type:complete len:490 (+),score=52.29 TRINITY_DN13998_c0_g1_i3:421-1890(+)
MVTSNANLENTSQISKQLSQNNVSPTPTAIPTPNSKFGVVQSTANFKDLIILFYPRIGSSSNSLIAYNPSTNKIAWSFNYEGGMFGPSKVFENGYFYVLVAEVGVQELLAMKAETGEVVWKLRNDESKPLCQYSSDGKEICVSGGLRDASGRKVDVEGDWGVYKQPAYSNGTLFVNLNSVIVALDADEGLPVRWVQNFTDEYNVQRYSPLVYDNIVYTITLREYSCNKTFNGWPYWTCSEAPYEFFALSEQTGEILWSRDFNILDEDSYFWFNWFEIGHHIVYDPKQDILYISVKYYMHKPSPFFQLYAIKPSDGTDIWSIKLDTDPDMSYRSLWDDYQNALLFKKDHLLYHVDTSLGMVRAIDAKIGNQVWQVPTNIRYSAGIIGNNNLYLSQQHISESVTSSEDNYILGVSLSSQETDTLGVCDWVQDNALMKDNKVVLYHRQCKNSHSHSHGNSSGNATHHKHNKSNKLLNTFVGVVVSTTVAVLF